MIVENIIRWVLADLKIEKQFDIEDMELMRLGFSWTEAQSFSIYRRGELLEASSIVSDWKAIIERKRQMEVATLSSGFASADTQRKIRDEWTAEINENLHRLKVYTLEEVGGDKVVKQKKTRKFADVLKGLKNGKNSNQHNPAQQTAEAHSQSSSHGSADETDPILQNPNKG